MSALGKVYLAVTSLALLVMAIAAAATLRDNTAWIEVGLWLPQLEDDELFRRRRYEVNVGALLGGWVVMGAVVGILALRGPFWVRQVAQRRRRLRALEREVLELRTLPLRQEAEDELLAAEAHIDAASTKVMTQKIDLERRGPRPGDSLVEPAPWKR